MNELPARSRWLALAVLCAGMLMIILDGTIVSVALPAVQADLGFTAEGLAWTVDARMLVLARFGQGMAAAMASAVVLGMIVGLFPEPAERARAIAAYAFVGAAGASIGTLLGGGLTETVGWRWIFLVNLPIGLLAALLALRVVPADRPAPRHGRPDVLGGVLVTAGLMVGVLGIFGAVGPAARLGLGALALGLLAAFVLRQRRAREPLVRLRLFGSRAVSVATPRSC